MVPTPNFLECLFVYCFWKHWLWLWSKYIQCRGKALLLLVNPRILLAQCTKVISIIIWKVKYPRLFVTSYLTITDPSFLLVAYWLEITSTSWEKYLRIWEDARLASHVRPIIQQYESAKRIFTIKVAAMKIMDNFHCKQSVIQAVSELDS